MTRLSAAALALAATLAVRPAAAELKPEEVAVVAARGNRGSEELAAYYVKARGIPADHICLIDVVGEEVCPRDQWTWNVRPEIRKWLDEHDPQHKLRCLVTVWGVPLKIGPGDVGAERIKYREFLEADRALRVKLLNQVSEQLDALAAHIAIPQPPPPAEGAAAQASDLAALQMDVERHLQEAQARVSKLEGAELQQAAVRLQQLATAAGGARVLLSGIEKRLGEQPQNAELRTQYDLLRGRAGGFLEMQVLLDQAPPGYFHDALMLAALERNGGMLAAIAWLDRQLDAADQNETGASFDSELALVLWDDDYELLRWQPNYLRTIYETSQWPKVFPTLMVARIDAPTLKLARGLIDVAIKTEKEGLSGKAYFDARGMGKLDGPPPTQGTYEDYDRALLTTAQAMGNETNFEVVLNTGNELFQDGDCPDAALYCGWYSLAKYVDAFDWRPGAVAYHLASGEATTLRDPASQAWCKKMIEDGVAATIGPVYEPYLMSFPRPEQFFGLLMNGEFTLVECYYRTLPFNSWMMTLIGDPLYRPFKNVNVRKDPAAAPVGETPGEAASEEAAPADSAPGDSAEATPATP